MKINGIRATRINAKSTFIRCLSGIYPGHAARMNCPDKRGVSPFRGNPVYPAIRSVRFWR